MNKDLYIYTCGSLTYLKKIGKLDIALKWRKKIDKWAEENNIRVFNPAKNFEKEVNHGYSGKLIVDQNDFFLNKTTIMIVQLEYLDYSPGSIYEIATFKHMKKPIIAFGESKHWSPHINTSISEYCKNIEDVIELLNNMFL